MYAVPASIDVMQMPRMISLEHDSKSYLGATFTFSKTKKRTKSLYLTEVDQSEILSRGWVFQEWFLSARIIHRPAIHSSNAKLKLHVLLETKTLKHQIKLQICQTFVIPKNGQSINLEPKASLHQILD